MPKIFVRDSYLLLDRRPFRTQFYPSRNSRLTGAVGIHTTESSLDRIAPDTGAEAVSDYIRIRPDAGSYAEIIDTDSVVRLVPDHYTTFSVGVSGYNSRTWNIALAMRSSELDPDDWATQWLIDTLGWRIVEFWNRNGFDVRAGMRWVGTRALSEQGLFNHGDVQPSDRSDAWARHPRRHELSDLLMAALERYGIGPAPEPIKLPTPKGRRMITIHNPVNGLKAKFAMNTNGHVMHTWQSTVGGEYGPWIPIFSDGFYEGFGVTLDDHGRMWAEAVGSFAYGGVLVGRFQPAPGAPFGDKFDVNGFLRYVRG